MEVKLIPISMTIPEPLAIKARVEAAKLNISRSQLVVRLLEKYIEEVEANKTNGNERHL